MNDMKELIAYRRQRAQETLNDAAIMYRNGSMFSAVNRIYYALFYEVLALLLLGNYSSSKHSGVKSLFIKEYVKNGSIDVAWGKFYSQMFEFRQKGDYEENVIFEPVKVSEWLERAAAMISDLELFIDKKILPSKHKIDN